MTVDAAAVAAWGLASAHHLPSRPVADDAFASLVSTCEHHRVLGLLGVAVRDGGFPVTDEQRTQLDERWQAWLSHAVRVEHLVLDLIATLEQAGIRAIVLKGVALAHTSYPGPEWRVFGDVDLLVPSPLFTRAATVLADVFAGTRAQPELRPGFDDRFGREILVRVGAIEVDLHRTFVDGAYGLTIATPDLAADPAPFRVGGRTLHGLGPAPRMLHTAYATELSDWPPRLVARRDLAQVLTENDPDPDTVLGLAARWRAEAVLASAVRDAWRTLRLTTRPPLVEWADRYRPARRDRMLLASYRGAARGYTSQAASVLVLPSWRDRAAYLRAIAWPSQAYREARGLGRWGLLGAGARKARRG